MKPSIKSKVVPKMQSKAQLEKTVPSKKLQQTKAKENGTVAEGQKKEKKWASVSLDEFINSNSENEDEDQSDIGSDEDLDEELSDIDEEGENGESEDDDSDAAEEDGEEDDEAEDEEGDSEEDSENEQEAAKKHKQTLEKLKANDPEFYKFLSENDRELLEFDTSDSEDEAGGAVHKPPSALEEASDDSDFEDKESTTKRQSNVLTQAMVDQWQQELQNNKCMKTIATVVSAFRSAVQSVTEENVGPTTFKVQGGAAFNAVVRLCIVDMVPALKRVLKAPAGEKLNVHNCKSWVKVRTQVKLYLADVIRLMGTLTESSLLSAMLKHVHQLIPFYAAFVKLSKVLCKRLVVIWSSSEDTIRVLAFLSLLRLARTQPTQLLEMLMKAMYLSYTRNCKFTSPSTWPVINFMRRSLVEILALQESLTYRHAFLYIRQLAIHLRNAVTLKKKDSTATVYNWQFVHCLHLWAALLGAVPNSQLLKPLIYPLVQIAIGAINLVPTSRYYPLRFHLVSILNQLSASSGVFIPILPFLLEVLQNYKFDKKSSKVSMKPLDLSCVLRVSKSQMAESGFRDAVIEILYDRLLETLQCHSHSSAFPEMSLPVVLQLKQFLKKCPLANYTKKMKHLLDKIQETVVFVEKQRSRVTFDLADTKAVLALENQIKQSGTPLTTYHESWKKMRDREMAIKIAKRPEMEKENKLPFIKKKTAEEEKNSKIQIDDGEFDGLFPSDMSDDEDDETRFLLKEERGLKRKAEGTDKSTKKVQKTEAKSEAPKKTQKVEPKTTKKQEPAKVSKTKPIQEMGEEASDDDDAEAADEVCDFDMSDDDDDNDVQDEESEDDD